MKLMIDDYLFTKEELENTPKRWDNFMKEWKNSGVFNFTTFPSNGLNNLICIKDIQFYSLCAHHCIPFFGKACVGYIPNKKIAGLSKLGRTVQHFASKPQLQEKLTNEIALFLEKKLQPKGVIVVLEAEHLCMSMRGIRLPGHKTITSSVTGVFLKPGKGKTPKEEFLRLIGK
jgi:GTP cyclohydrolase I